MSSHAYSILSSPPTTGTACTKNAHTGDSRGFFKTDAWLVLYFTACSHIEADSDQRGVVATHGLVWFWNGTSFKLKHMNRADNES